MAITVDIENASTDDDVPDASSMRCWVSAALMTRQPDAEVAIRIVDEDESAELNNRYRGKAGPTNILSFPADLPEALAIPLLGDLLVCAPIVTREAARQGKQADAHWAHILIHGTLHLLGYDHVRDEDARDMEALETEIVTGLGFPPPYDDISTTQTTRHETTCHD